MAGCFGGGCLWCRRNSGLRVDLHHRRCLMEDYSRVIRRPSPLPCSGAFLARSASYRESHIEMKAWLRPTCVTRLSMLSRSAQLLCKLAETVFCEA